MYIADETHETYVATSILPSRRYREESDSLLHKKTKRVILSCTTLEQLEVASRYAWRAVSIGVRADMVVDAIESTRSKITGSH